jgi:hydrogenase expression/formation protein HypC
MCLAIPLRVIKIETPMATVDMNGAETDVSLLLLPEELSIGDYVLVHAGFAIQKLDEEAAKESLELLHEIAEALDKETLL